MFKNRVMTVKINKDDKTKDAPPRPMREDRFPLYKDAAKKAFIAGTMAVYGYVLVDTYRQKTVAQAIYHPKQ